MHRRMSVIVYNPDPDLSLDRAFDKIKDAHIVGQASCGDVLLDHVKSASPDVIAVNLDTRDGLDTIERIALASPGAPVIGISSQTDPETIIKAMRAGCAQFVLWPIDKADLQAALDRISAARLVTPVASKTICVVGSAGGAGATTVACNLAVELADLVARRCALVDMCLDFGDVACFFDSHPDYSVADLCASEVEVDQAVLDRGFHELANKVSILARPERAEHLHSVCPEGIAKMLATARESYPFIVVDLPRSLSEYNAAALDGADLVLIVTQLGVPFIRNANRIHHYFRELGAPDDGIKIVLNRCEGDAANISPKHVEEHFGKPAFGMIPNDYRRVQSSLDHGHAFATSAPRSAVRATLRDMARKIATDHLRHERPATEADGLLGRLWKWKPPSRRTPVGSRVC